MTKTCTIRNNVTPFLPQNKANNPHYKGKNEEGNKNVNYQVVDEDDIVKKERISHTFYIPKIIIQDNRKLTTNST